MVQCLAGKEICASPWSPMTRLRLPALPANLILMWLFCKVGGCMPCEPFKLRVFSRCPLEFNVCYCCRFGSYSLHGASLKVQRQHRPGVCSSSAAGCHPSSSSSLQRRVWCRCTRWQNLRPAPGSGSRSPPPACWPHQRRLCHWWQQGVWGRRDDSRLTQCMIFRSHRGCAVLIAGSGLGVLP